MGSVCSPVTDVGLGTSVLDWLNDGHSLELAVLNTWLFLGATEKSLDSKLKARVRWSDELLEKSVVGV